MQIFGLDFTSAPTPAGSRAARRKRLMLAACRLDGVTLEVEEIRPLNGDAPDVFAPFEAWLRSGGEWVAGLDFPFGQPAQLVRDLGWPRTWDGYVAHVEALGKSGFEQALIDYAESRPSGQKELFRPVDVKAKSVSPMKLNYVPVAKMFFQGATRLRRSPVAVHPVRPVASESRIVVEAYPALVARKWLGRRPYKNDDPAKSGDALRVARRDLIDAIRAKAGEGHGPSIRDRYGFAVRMDDDDADRCVADPTGDRLDSILCAVQAGWAYAQRGANYGVPADVDPLEGWIIDPEMRS